MHHLRDHRGHAGAELVGVLLLVTLTIGALAHGGAPRAIAAEVDALICRIQGGDCAPPAAPPAASGPEDAPGEPPQGLPLAGEDLIVLPFPGSLAVRGRAGAEGGVERDGRQATVGVSASATSTVTRSGPLLGPDGCPIERLGVSTTLQLAATGGARTPHAGGALEGHLGKTTGYQVGVAPDQAEAIGAGDRRPPNPVDPTTLRPGESVVLSEEYYAGLGLSASYRVLRASLGYDRGTRVSSGVVRVDDSTVRVLVGDEDFVRQSVALGFGIDGANVALAGNETLGAGKLHAIDIDISTSAGWAAYQDFVATGELPAAGTAGTTNPTRSDVVNYSDETRIEGTAGPVTIGGVLGSSEGRLLETTNADGSITTLATGRFNGVGWSMETSVDAEGRPLPGSRYGLTLGNVHPALAAELGGYAPGSAVADGGNLRIDFDAGGLTGLRVIALRDLAARVEENEGGRVDVTPAEITESLRDGDGVVEYDGYEYAFDPGVVALAAAETPEEILIALSEIGAGGHANRVVANLIDLLRAQDAELPGELGTPQCED